MADTMSFNVHLGDDKTSVRTMEDAYDMGKSTEVLKSNENLPEGQKKFQYVAALAATLGAFGLGSALGYTSPGLPKMQKDPILYLTPAEVSWVGSLINIGAMLSCPATGFLISKFGRKMTMMGLTIPFAIGWIFIASAVHVSMLYIGRLIVGFSGGAFSVVAPVYISETAEVSVRGALGSYFQLMVTLGILFSYLVGWGVSWQWLATICTAVPLIFAGIFYFMPESPSYSILIGNKKAARDALQKLRGPNYNVEPELKIIEIQVRESQQRSGSFKDLTKGIIKKLMIVSMGLMVFQQLSGVNAVIFYTADIFEAAGMNLDPNASAVIIGVVQCVATFCSSLLVERAGRKMLLLISGTAMGIAHILLGVYFYIKNTGDASSIGFLPLLSLIAFMIFFSIGYGPIPWMVMGELFPLEVKELASSTAATVNWFLSFIVTVSFSPLTVAITEQGVYWMFSGICFLGVAFVFFFVKETKGKSQEQIMVEYGR